MWYGTDVNIWFASRWANLYSHHHMFQKKKKSPYLEGIVLKMPADSPSLFLSVFMAPATLVANSENLKGAASPPWTSMPLTRCLMSREMCRTTQASSAMSDAFPSDLLGRDSNPHGTFWNLRVVLLSLSKICIPGAAC